MVCKRCCRYPKVSSPPTSSMSVAPSINLRLAMFCLSSSSLRDDIHSPVRLDNLRGKTTLLSTLSWPLSSIKLLFWNGEKYPLISIKEKNQIYCCSEINKKNSLMNFLEGWRKCIKISIKMHKIKILHLLNLEKFSSTTVIGLDFKILILHHFHDLGKIGNSSLAQYSKFPVFISPSL